MPPSLHPPWPLCRYLHAHINWQPVRVRIAHANPVTIRIPVARRLTIRHPQQHSHAPHHTVQYAVRQRVRLVHPHWNCDRVGDGVRQRDGDADGIRQCYSDGDSVRQHHSQCHTQRVRHAHSHAIVVSDADRHTHVIWHPDTGIPAYFLHGQRVSSRCAVGNRNHDTVREALPAAGAGF
jgi:hypothetical protein